MPDDSAARPAISPYLERPTRTLEQALRDRNGSMTDREPDAGRQRRQAAEDRGREDPETAG